MDTMTIVIILLVVWFLIGLISSIRFLTDFMDIKGDEILLVILMSLGGLITALGYYFSKNEKTIFFKKR
jgi:cytochrome c oxidase subunit IV